MVTQNVPSSPSLSRTGSARRPNTLALGSGKAPSGSNSPKSPGSSSPTKPTKSPGSPATTVKGRAAPKRSGSLGKGSQVTRPVGPNLSTEARSLVRPCGCGKPGHGTARGNGHKDGHVNGHHAHEDAQHSQHASPVPERKERPKKTVKSPTKAKAPPAQIMPPPPPTQAEEPVQTNENDSNTNGSSSNDEDSSSKQESTQVSYQDLKNRYISTLVWVPRIMTEKCF